MNAKSLKIVIKMFLTVTLVRWTERFKPRTSHPGQLSLLPSAGKEIEYQPRCGDLCGWGVKAGKAHSICRCTMGGG